MAVFGLNPEYYGDRRIEKRSDQGIEAAQARQDVLDANGTPEEAMDAYDAVIYRVNPISDPSRSKIFTSDYKAYQRFIASGGLDKNATFIGDKATGIGLGHEDFTAADYEAWQRAQGYVESVDPPLVCPPGMVDNGYGVCVVAHGLFAPEDDTGQVAPLDGRDPVVVTQPDTAAIDFFDQPGLAQQWALQHFPWAKDLNLGRMIEAAVTEGIDDDVLIAQVRDTPQYLATFPGITDEDGRMRFKNEQSYVDQVREYRNVLIDAGSIGSREIFNPRTENPVDYATLMERGISTDELQNRLDTYRDLTNNSAHVRATFKIYANMDVSVDDLYQAVVDPEASRTLVGRYNENLLNANFDYSNWVANATSAALEATAETLSILEAQGALPEGAVARINALTDQQAQGLVEALYLGDPDNEDPLLDLDELIEAFQFALIGGAAAEQGLGAPSMARGGAFRQAGITRATALKGYGAYVNQGSMIESMLSRTNIREEGAARFGQEDFENAVFLSQAPEVDLITRARQDEMARGRAPGGFATTSRGARLAQPGRTGGGVRY